MNNTVETVAAFVPEIGKIVKLSSDRYEEMKQESRAFHTKHAVTKLYRENQQLKGMIAEELEK